MKTEKEFTTATFYPVTGAAGVNAADAAVYDGRWRVLDESSKAVDAAPGLADVSVELLFGYLVLRAPGMLRLDIPLDVIEDEPSVLETITLDGQEVCVADEGDWAATWFTQVTGQPVRLVKVCTDTQAGGEPA